MDSTTLHLLLGLSLLILTLAIGLLSIKVVHFLETRGHASHFVLSLLNCFAGGVFLGVCFLDMIPDVNEKYEEYVKETGQSSSFPWPQFFTCIGFFLVYVVEEGCFSAFQTKNVQDESTSTDSNQKIVYNDLEMKHTAEISEGHGHSHSHGHHGPPSGDLLRAVTFAAAISFHSLLEGFALGVQESTSGVITLFVSLLLHKAVEAFSVGLQVSKGNHSRTKAVICTIFVYSLMSPLGTLIGTVIQSSGEGSVKDGLILVLEGLACGSFVYVTFMEVLSEEKGNRNHNFIKLMAVFAGFLVIALLVYTFGEGGDESVALLSAGNSTATGH